MTLDITEEIRVAAPLDKAFAALLEELGPANRGQNDVPMPMMLEAWPGGRWFRDLGNGNGTPVGPCTGHQGAGAARDHGAAVDVLRRRVERAVPPQGENGGTIITLKHSAFGRFPDGYGAPASQGWKNIFARVRQRVESAR
jgi:hypothetical protein